ncbi:hypothetical protein TVAG_167810 [Trichomonas vaginalis G3]|uniref:Uncharacterized protein n=1 Tax=Trichomonas vaginalis (strain ATCC PRA-98 / G3) TaxID=412133 RepID=A2FLB9_TRIV3|nr:hypothetical protein TVAGG3_0717440 [Trichomonas vaginalis G3]EAX94300.1 hypothetical protein TVAG_167810 [Trichomonas vaginalis G3]KAI5510346.1 hypothetical protein TVAGG3_0717440 [Trichomonas vaginalis G3]|eukprot:XP_001307230.1 hypothetical protein [Trichomonas vaginalis G3]
MALSVSDRKYIHPLIEQIQQRCLGLRVKAKEFELISGQKTPELISIPLSITYLKEATTWMKEYHGLNSQMSLGSIGFNDNLIVLNLCHNMCDGRFMANLASELSDENAVNIRPIEGCPIEPSTYFTKEVSLNNKECKVCGNDPQIARYITKGVGKIAPKYTESYWYRFPMKELACFNSKTQTATKLLEHQIAAVSLAAASMNSDKEYYNMGASCPVDIRRFTPSTPYEPLKSIDSEIVKKYSFANFVASVSAYTKAKPSETIRDILPRIRECMNDKIKSGEQFKFLYTMQKVVEAGGVQGEFPDGAGIEVSSIGSIKVGGRIKDYLFSHVINGEESSKSIEFVTYSLKTPTNYDFSGYLNYMPGDATVEEAGKLLKCFEFSLKHVEDNTTVGDAIKLIRKEVL